MQLFSRPLDLPPEAVKLAGEGNFELKGYSFSAKKDDTQAPRVVRFAVVQNEIVKPTTAPILEQARRIATPTSNIYLNSVKYIVSHSHCERNGFGLCKIQSYIHYNCYIIPYKLKIFMVSIALRNSWIKYSSMNR